MNPQYTDPDDQATANRLAALADLTNAGVNIWTANERARQAEVLSKWAELQTYLHDRDHPEYFDNPQLDDAGNQIARIYGYEGAFLEGLGDCLEDYELVVLFTAAGRRLLTEAEKLLIEDGEESHGSCRFESADESYYC